MGLNESVVRDKPCGCAEPWRVWRIVGNRNVHTTADHESPKPLGGVRVVQRPHQRGLPEPPPAVDGREVTQPSVPGGTAPLDDKLPHRTRHEKVPHRVPECRVQTRRRGTVEREGRRLDGQAPDPRPAQGAPHQGGAGPEGLLRPGKSGRIAADNGVDPVRGAAQRQVSEVLPEVLPGATRPQMVQLLEHPLPVEDGQEPAAHVLVVPSVDPRQGGYVLVPEVRQHLERDPAVGREPGRKGCRRRPPSVVGRPPSSRAEETAVGPWAPPTVVSGTADGSRAFRGLGSGHGCDAMASMVPPWLIPAHSSSSMSALFSFFVRFCFFGGG